MIIKFSSILLSGTSTWTHQIQIPSNHALINNSYHYHIFRNHLITRTWGLPGVRCNTFGNSTSRITTVVLNRRAPLRYNSRQVWILTLDYVYNSSREKKDIKNTESAARVSDRSFFFGEKSIVFRTTAKGRTGLSRAGAVSSCCYYYRYRHGSGCFPVSVSQ